MESGRSGMPGALSIVMQLGKGSTFECHCQSFTAKILLVLPAYLVLQLVYHIAGIAGVGILLVNCLVGIAWYTWYCWYCRHTWYYSWYIILLVLVYCLYIVLPVLPGIPGIAGVIRCDSRTSP